ncbi:MAG: hypothetical protein ACE5NC_05885 [Anaerolineae bacterium]
MAKISASLMDQLQQDPGSSVRLIIRTRGDPDQNVRRLEERGLRVARRLQLVRSLAVRGKASAGLAILDEDWVVAIEEDRPVKAA